MDVKQFEIELEKMGVTTLNKLYYVTGAKNCNTLVEADKYYEELPKWDSTNYWRDRDNITEEQYNFINVHRELAHQLIRQAVDNICSYGPLD